MTTLVAIQGDGWSVIGCDSRASDEDGRYMELATSKVINNNGVLIAVSGASRGGNITQFGWKPPKPRATEDLDSLYLACVRRFKKLDTMPRMMAMQHGKILTLLFLYVEPSTLSLTITLGTEKPATFTTPVQVGM